MTNKQSNSDPAKSSSGIVFLALRGLEMRHFLTMPIGLVHNLRRDSKSYEHS